MKGGGYGGGGGGGGGGDGDSTKLGDEAFWMAGVGVMVARGKKDERKSVWLF